jgi:hypothetical protein
MGSVISQALINLLTIENLIMMNLGMFVGIILPFFMKSGNYSTSSVYIYARAGAGTFTADSYLFWFQLWRLDQRDFD